MFKPGKLWNSEDTWEVNVLEKVVLYPFFHLKFYALLEVLIVGCNGFSIMVKKKSVILHHGLNVDDIKTMRTVIYFLVSLYNYKIFEN